jgi:hypothetical protein
MSTQPGTLPLLPELVPEQEHLMGYIPTVVGPVEFRKWRQQLERIDEILVAGVEETFQRLSLARRNEQEQRTAEAENRPFPESECRRASQLPAVVFASIALQCGAHVDGRELPGLRLPVIGVDAAATVLQAGSHRQGADSGQKCVATLRPMAHGRRNTEGDRHAHGSGKRSAGSRSLTLLRPPPTRRVGP